MQLQKESLSQILSCRPRLVWNACWDTCLAQGHELGQLLDYNILLHNTKYLNTSCDFVFQATFKETAGKRSYELIIKISFPLHVWRLRSALMIWMCCMFPLTCLGTFKKAPSCCWWLNIMKRTEDDGIKELRLSVRLVHTDISPLLTSCRLCSCHELISFLSLTQHVAVSSDAIFTF